MVPNDILLFFPRLRDCSKYTHRTSSREHVEAACSLLARLQSTMHACPFSGPSTNDRSVRRRQATRHARYFSPGSEPCTKHVYESSIEPINHCRSVRPHQATRHEEHDASLQEYERRLGQLRAEALAEVGPGAYVEGPACPLLVDFR